MSEDIHYGAPPFGGERDERRVLFVIAALYQLWEKHPQQRLSQLLYNVVRLARDEEGRETMPCPDFFYAEDDAVMRGIKAYLERPPL